ncbi:MAG: cobyrinate a,c-diamide synthase [Halobacteriota archaeon]|nr:cobyrinate a,c-diamide synthase [Halobacteriota archaeon]
MKIPRLILAGSGSAIGKTTISSGIMHALVKRGYDVQPFKVGPDYIDPGYHTSATGNFSRNLDSFLMDEDTIAEIFTRNVRDISIIEGVRGLYEGISVEDEIGSTAHISKILRSPVILIVNVKSITKSAAAIVLGFKELDPEINIAGVIVNNVRNRSHKDKVTSAIENLGVEVLGAIPVDERMKISHRHLGLYLPHEDENLSDTLKNLRDVVEENVDLDRMIEIADSAEDLPQVEENIFKKRNEDRLNVAIAYDKAFNFYYSDSLDLLRLHGCNLKFFSPLQDKSLPEDIDGLYLGGGYPEVFAEELSNNKSIMREIYKLAGDGMPVYAECGGLVYLSKSFKDSQLVGFLPCAIKMAGRHISFTICRTVRASIVGDKNRTLKGHEFHYTTLEEIPDDMSFGYEMLRGDGIDTKRDGIIQNNTFASYTHLHFASNGRVVESLVKSFEEYGRI